MSKLPTRYMIDLTREEIKAQFASSGLVVLPAGSVEQHGPHLPVGTDTIINQGHLDLLVGRAPRDLDIRILATDIDPNVVATAREGNYSSDSLEQIQSQQRNLVVQSRSSGQIRMSDDLKALISFGELNLMGDWPMKGKFDFIFCRNVAIYFDDKGSIRVSYFERDIDPATAATQKCAEAKVICRIIKVVDSRVPSTERIEIK